MEILGEKGMRKGLRIKDKDPKNWKIGDIDILVIKQCRF